MSENTTATVNEAPKPGTKDALKAENDALKAENDALKAELEAQKAEKEAMATATTEPEVPYVPAQERVDLFVEKGYANDEPNQLISVNGVNYLLPKGKTSKVPKFVADEYYRSRRAQQRLDETVDKMLAEASK